MVNKKPTAYTRGKYKPRKDKGSLKEGSIMWWRAQGLSDSQARKKVKELKTTPQKLTS